MEKKYEHFRFVVDPGQKLLRIDKYLMDRVENTSRSKIQNAAEKGEILVNNTAVKSNYKVKPGDEISVVMDYPPREIEIIPENLPLSIHYEDDYLIVVNKQAGQVVHPGYGNYTGTLVNALAYHLKGNPIFENNDIRPGLVHRLDKNTSGLIVVAKDEDTKNHLADQFFRKVTKRSYRALVWSDFNHESGTITGNLGRHPKNRKLTTVFPDGEAGKHAVTHYNVIEHLKYTAFIECKLETGRTHQIRAHTKYINHPVFNDSEYGGDKILRGKPFSKYKQFVENCFQLIPRQALHAKSLGFTHPYYNTEMFFDSELPEDMANVLQKWRNYVQSVL